MPARPLPDGRVPVLLSAHEEDLVGAEAAAILSYLDRESSVAGVPEVAATLLRTRRVRRHRALVRAADRAELVAGLQAIVDGDEHSLVTRSSTTAAPPVAFVCPGQGNQWPSMGAEAYRRLPAYRAAADTCAQAFTAAGRESPLPYLLDEDDQPDRRWSQIAIQGAQFTHSVSLAQVWRSCGILPAITVGQSLGEVAAAYLAGTISLADAVGVVAARAVVVEQLSGQYGMAVLGVGVDEAEQVIDKAEGWLEISAVNSASSTVVSGECDAVAATVRRAEQQSVFARAIAVDYPGHTSALEPLQEKFTDLLPASAFLDAPVEFVGSTWGTVVGTDAEFCKYWCENLRNTVRFDRAVATAIERGAGGFVELSAHPSLLVSLLDQVDDESAPIVGSGRRNEPVDDQLSANISAVALADPGYHWADAEDLAGQPPLPHFPNAPMRSIHLWAKPQPLPPPPGAVLTVAEEDWQPQTEPAETDGTPTRCGVALVGPGVTETSVAERLTEAITTHDGCFSAVPADAEIVVVVSPDLGYTDAAAAADEIATRDDAELPDYTAVIGPRCRNVWLLTAAGVQVQPDDPVALPAQAALAAMHRSVGFEFPDQTFAHLDLPSWDIDADTARACVDVLIGDTAEVALRHGGGPAPRRYLRVLRESGEPAPERSLSADALDNVVITGGSGAIGLRYARHCVEGGARRLVLLSRKGISADDVEELVEGHRVEVHAPACDITDVRALTAVAAEYGGDGASLLIHAAGTARFGARAQVNGADLADVFGAKVAGLARMATAWPLRSDARIVVCSSVSGVWGGHGHIGYAASNRMVDVLAAQLRAKGLDCMAVRWGLWQGTSIADADEIARIERSGLIEMDPDAAIGASLRQHSGDPLIIAADFARLRRFFESQGIPMPFAMANESDGPADDDSNGSGQASVADVVRDELASALSIDAPSSVDLHAALIDLGVDSLLALDLRKRLRRRTGSTVPLAELLGGITVAGLIDTLQESQGADGSAAPNEPERVKTSSD